MEQIRSCIAVEQEIKVSPSNYFQRGVRSCWLLAFFWALPTGLAHGHGMQYLLAKLSLQPGGIRMEITADYSGNPLIVDESAAREAITTMLNLHLGKEISCLVEENQIQFRKTSTVDPTCPVKIPPPPEGSSHDFLTGIFDRVISTDSLRLSVPKGNPNDVVLWLETDGSHSAMTQKYYLIAGDETPVFTLPKRPPLSWSWLGAIILISIAILIRKRHKIRATHPSHRLTSR